MARDFFNKIYFIIMILERVGRFVFGYIYSLLLLTVQCRTLESLIR